MQPYALLQTKLYIPPIRPGLVSRPRLLERLNAGLATRDEFSRTRDEFSRALTLVSAPAGFGKTTLVSEWARNSGWPVAWLSLDEGDNDPARFLAYLIAALRGVEVGQDSGREIGHGMLSALHSPQPPPAEVVLTSLINDLTDLPDRIVLVLDDYHLIDAQQIHDALSFLLEHLPPQLHLVIATRDDPHLPFARLRAQGQLTELRAAELRFTTSEAAEFLNRTMGLDLSAEDVAALERRTEGWIAGLQLAAISMQGHPDAASQVRSFTGSHRFVLDYLIEEVLEQQPESVQAFLLQTAILDRLSGPLCDAVRSGVARAPSTAVADAARPDGAESHGALDSSQAILERLERANLFILPLDAERRWYRYHHLFSDLLKQRLHQTQAEWVPALHKGASAWYEENGFTDEAIEHALQAGALERAASLIEERVDAIWQRGEHIRLRRWLAGLPEALVFSKPHLCILQAWNLFTSGHQDAAEQSLQAAEEAIGFRTGMATEPSRPERVPLPDLEKMQVRGRAAAIRAFLAFYRGDVAAIQEYAGQALAYLPEQDLTWRSTATVALGDAYAFAGDMAAAYRVRLEALQASQAAGNLYMTLIASTKLAVTLRQQGRLQRVLEVCQQQLQLAYDRGLSQTIAVGWALAVWGEVLAELDDLDGAIAQAEKGTGLTERGRDVAMIGWSYLCLIRVLFSRGDMAGAEATIRKMEGIGREYHVPPWVTSLMAAWQARIWLAQGNLEAAFQWVAARGLDAGADPPVMRETEYMALARILSARGRLDQAGRLLRRLLDATKAGGRTARAIQIHLIQALALQAGGEPDQAIDSLQRALTLAEPGGFVRTFVDEGPPMAQLLCEAAARGIAPGYVRRLLAAFPDAEPGHPEADGSRVPQTDLVETLSERELELLRLVAAGLTNREIAARLYLSLNTVKAHTRNIYGKLDVHSRTQAVARAQGLGLLPFT